MTVTSQALFFVKDDSLNINCFKIVDLYRDYILDQYQNPRNWGRLANPTYSAEVYNDFCGDRIVFDISVDQKTRNVAEQTIKAVAFKSEGCVISSAAASILSERIKGKTISQLKKIKPDDIVKMLGVELTPTRLKCALFPLEAIHKALGKISESNSD